MKGFKSGNGNTYAKYREGMGEKARTEAERPLGGYCNQSNRCGRLDQGDSNLTSEML